MSDLRLLLAAIVVLLPGSVQAGTVSGRVATAGGPGARSQREATPVPVVVWIEGPRASAPTRDRPVLSQKNVQFSSPVLVVVAGQTVDMPNEDVVAHNVYSRSAAKPFNLGIYGKGRTKSVTFDQVGVIDVLCTIHRRMRAQILVVPNPYHALTVAGSHYQISRVPAGQYTLHTWSNGLAETRQEIAVPANGEVTFNLSLAEAR